MINKTKLANFFDFVALFLTIFLLIYFAFSFVIQNKIVHLSATIFLSIVTFLTIHRTIHIHTSRKNLSINEENKLKSCLLALKFGEPKKIRKFWLIALSKTYTTINHKYFIEVKNSTQTINIVYDFSKTELSLFDLLSLKSKITNNNKTKILSTSFSSDCYEYVKNDKSIRLIDGKHTYLVLKQLNCFPTIKKEQISKITYKNRFISSLTRKNTLKFIRYASLLLLFSIIVPFATYYKIFSLVLYLLAIISFFRPAKHENLQKIYLFN